MSMWQAAAALAEWARPYRRSLRAVVGFALLGAGGLAAQPLIIKEVFDEYTKHGLTAALHWWDALLIVLAAFALLTNRRRDRLAAGVGANVSRDLIPRLADRKLRAVEKSPGLAVTTTSGLDGVKAVVAQAGLPPILGSSGRMAIGAVVALMLDLRVGVVMLLAAVPIAWLTTRQARWARKATEVYMRDRKLLGAEVDRFYHPMATEVIAAIRARSIVLDRIKALASSQRAAVEERLAINLDRKSVV